MKKLLLVLFLLPLFAHAQTSPYCGPFTPSTKLNLNGVHGRTIEYQSFNNITDFQIHLTNCSDIVIRYCRFKGSRAKAVRLDNCVRVTVQYDYFEDCYGAFYATNCTGGNIHFDNNEGLNITGTDAAHVNSFWQLNNCSGPNITANLNSLQNDFGAGINPNPGLGDLFNMYQSNGTSSSPIQVWDNQMVGGGTGVGSSGFAGILCGDQGGSYQDVRRNTLINTGYVGIQSQGGTHITITLNTIVGVYKVWSRAGISSANFSGTPSLNNETSHNQVFWMAGYSGTAIIAMPGVHSDLLYKPGSGSNSNALPTGWSTNTIWPASSGLTPSILPNPLVSPCALPVFTYAPLTNTWVYGYTISTLTPVNTGGAVISYSVSPSLPSGVVLNTTTGMISGTATQTHASANYSVIATNSDGSDTATLTLQINKAVLGVVADSKSKFQGTANPALTVTYSPLNGSNFRNGDTPSSLTIQPTASTTATMSSPAGTYLITASGGVSSNYSFAYVPGVLLIIPNATGPTHKIRGRSKVVRVN